MLCKQPMSPCGVSVSVCVTHTSREVWKIKPRRTAASVEPSTHGGVRRPLFAQDDVEVFVTGSTLYAGDEERSTPLDTTPLVITPFPAAVGHRRTEPGGYFCWKLTLTRTHDPIRHCAVGMLKLTTDKHEASRGLSVTAELLVIVTLASDLPLRNVVFG